MSPPENLHLTLRFFGEWPEERLQDLLDKLEAVPRPAQPFTVQVHGLRFLPDPANPRVFMALLEAQPALLELQRVIEQQARELGMEPERRAYIPHVTLGRIRDARQGRRLVTAVRENPLDLGVTELAGFSLFESRMGDKSSAYTILRRWNFG